MVKKYLQSHTLYCFFPIYSTFKQHQYLAWRQLYSKMILSSDSIDCCISTISFMLTNLFPVQIILPSASSSQCIRNRLWDDFAAGSALILNQLCLPSWMSLSSSPPQIMMSLFQGKIRPIGERDEMGEKCVRAAICVFCVENNDLQTCGIILLSYAEICKCASFLQNLAFLWPRILSMFPLSTE